MSQIDRRGNSYRARYYDPLGQRRTKSFARKADAERFLREMRVEIDRGRWLDPRGAELPVAEWSDEFLSLCRRLSPTTQQTYRRDIGKFILPRFGAYRIGRLPADEIENWLNDEIDAGVAPSSVHRHYRTFRRMLQVAVEKEKLIANPFDRVEPPRVRAREMVFLTWTQVLELAEAHPDRYRAMIYLAVDSGMRWSELVGLRQSKLDLRRGKVRVTEQLIRLEAGMWIRKEPKTGSSIRSITVSEFTTAVLEDHLGQYAGSGPDGLVFPNRAGNALIASSFHTHYFKPALEKAGLACRFHDLRHTSVALAIEAGAHPKAIQTRMGHSSINVTLDRYGHLFPELDESIAVSFNERLANAKSEREKVVVHAAFGDAS